ncbi:integrase [Pseudaminobacter arsenicus]|uniref:Integrase n=1 Tax=Borborobacter arsenicus TaxID=1851146 RepID=A0A432V0M3_9HYPH|nr:integrase [Pseudaminobacter arsenicus]RUM95592.1 integrase [Pseudaminobacter arsenicus]
METVKAPGLKWRKLAGGLSPIWVADETDVKNGYTPKTVNLKHLADQQEMLVAKCNALQADMLLWRTGYRRDLLKFDGTIRSLLDVYELHERSPYRKLKPGSRRPYNHYLRRLRGHVGAIRISDVSGVDILSWHDVWSENGKHLAAAAMARSVLDAAISFGIMLRFAGCVELSTVLRETRKKLPAPKSRDASMTAEQVIRLRQAAHKRGEPIMALAYALAFETVLRLWDVVGQWVPMDTPIISDVIDPDRNEKWHGLRWEDIDGNLFLEYIPSKTADTTGKAIIYPLSKAPMVVEELAHWPAEVRKGPVIVSPTTRLPYLEQNWRKRYNSDRKAADIASNVWARDLRASGISEGRANNASIEDAAKVAGHSGTRTTKKVYDRAVLEAADRFAEARIRGRERSGNGSGNVR